MTRNQRRELESTTGSGTLLQAASKIREWRERPVQFVEEHFGVKPDKWQRDALEAFPVNPRLAMKACKGPGKTATLAWIGWNFLLTRPHPRGGATSITGDNLRANLWTELSHWRNKSGLLKTMFEQTGKEIYARDHAETWKLEARTWAKDATPDQIGNSLAGLHAPYVIWLGDECGDYPPSIIPIMEAIFAGNPIEAHVVLAGNPTSRAGALYLVCTNGLWPVITITGDPDDPKRSPRIAIEYAREMIKTYGRDNPWVKVGILGLFPDADINVLIGMSELEAATKRAYREDDIANAARVLGVDVARQGDDESVLYKRQGLVTFAPTRWRNIDGIVGAGSVAHIWNDWQADACFIDGTGGWATSWVDNLKLLGRNAISIGFATQASQPERFMNKRAEMYFDAAQYIKAGGQIPNVPRLLQAMSSITYTHRGDRMLMEDKPLFKTRMGWSPDDADAFILTHAQPVASSRRQRHHLQGRALPEYDAFAEAMRAPSMPGGYRR